MDDNKFSIRESVGESTLFRPLQSPKTSNEQPHIWNSNQKFAPTINMSNENMISDLSSPEFKRKDTK